MPLGITVSGAGGFRPTLPEYGSLAGHFVVVVVGLVFCQCHPFCDRDRKRPRFLWLHPGLELLAPASISYGCPLRLRRQARLPDTLVTGGLGL